MRYSWCQNTPTKLQMHLPCDLILETLSRNDGDFFTHPLIRVEVHGEFSIVLLNDDPRGLLDCFCPHTPLHGYILEG